MFPETLRQNSDLRDSSREAEFLQGLAGAYRDIYAAGLSVVGNRSDADDVIQEVCVVLWQKFDEFESGTSFRKWACAVTFNVAKAQARRQRRRRTAGLSDQALSRIAHVRAGASELLELRRDALRDCLGRLSASDRQFLLHCYRSRQPLVKLARELNSPVASLYTRLKRLRWKLGQCIQRRLGSDPDNR